MEGRVDSILWFWIGNLWHIVNLTVSLAILKHIEEPASSKLENVIVYESNYFKIQIPGNVISGCEGRTAPHLPCALSLELISSEMLVLRVLTNERRVFRVLTNERRVFRVLTNERQVLPD